MSAGTVHNQILDQMDDFKLLHCGILADFAHFSVLDQSGVVDAKENKMQRWESLTDVFALLAASIDTSPTMATLQIALLL